MKDRDRQLATDYDKQSIIPGIRLIIAIALQVKKTIVDYGLGAAILGVLPLYGSWIPPIRIILLIALNLKMASNIARSWGYHIEQDMDLGLLLYRDDYYNQDSDDLGIMEIIVGKNRNGSTGTCRVVFNQSMGIFSEVSKQIN